MQSGINLQLNSKSKVLIWESEVPNYELVGQNTNWIGLQEK